MHVNVARSQANVPLQASSLRRSHSGSPAPAQSSIEIGERHEPYGATVFATVVLLVKMELIGYAARLAAETTLSRADLRAAGIQLVVHAAGGLLVLLVPAVLSVYKPPGVTRYGQREQYEQEALS